MTITFNLSERAAANLLAEALAQGRPQSALIAETLEERYGQGGSPTAAAIAKGEDDPYAAAARFALADGIDGRAYIVDDAALAEADTGIASQYRVTERVPESV